MFLVFLPLLFLLAAVCTHAQLYVVNKNAFADYMAQEGAHSLLTDIIQ